jgi:peptidyl-prolyl cis-trans isomerase C
VKKVAIFLMAIGIFLTVSAPLAIYAADPVLAVIGKQQIKESDLDALLEGVPPQFRSQWDTPQGRQRLLNQLIDTKLVAREAFRQGLEKKPEVIVKIQNMTDRILVTEYIKVVQANIVIEEPELKAYYDGHKAEFSQPPQVRARHILLKTEADANAVLAEIKAGGDFATLAKAKSTGPSKDKGGDLGWFGRGRMVKSFEDAAFALEKGQVSGVVQTKFGYHIIKVEDKREAVDKPFNQVKEQVRSAVLKEKTQAALEEVKTKWRQELNVQVMAPPPAN